MLKKLAALSLVCAGLATWISCGKTSSHYLYGAIPGSNEILVYREDPNSGVLTQLSFSPVAAGQSVQSLALHPSNSFLYAANAGENDISLFAIASDGSLTEQGQRTPAGTAPTVLAMDASGSYLYVANSGSQNISVFSIASSGGTLTEVSGSPFQVGFVPTNIKLAPSGGVLYVAVAGSPGYVLAYGINAGVLSPPAVFVTGTNPYGLAIASSGSYLYTANTGDNSISEFALAGGTLTPLAGSPIGQVNLSPVSLLIDKSGNFLYVANEGSGNVSAYSIGSDGSLTLLTNSPFATGSEPSLIASDPSGQYLFVGNQSGAAIQSFSVASGTLTSVASYPVAGTPTSIAIVP
jgi:6-phosphogluconolactonase (cycloisomerase 2 family)